jgi:hypothetical protein
VKALCLIPPTTFPKGQPVSASVQLPPGTAEVYWWFVAAPLMQERRTFRGLAEIRWRAAGGNFADSTLTSVRVAGGPGQASGGMANEQPATLPRVEAARPIVGPSGSGSRSCRRPAITAAAFGAEQSLPRSTRMGTH